LGSTTWAGGPAAHNGIGKKGVPIILAVMGSVETMASSVGVLRQFQCGSSMSLCDGGARKRRWMKEVASDPSDKSHQVRMMDKIFSRAKTVLVYQGEHAQASHLSTDRLDIIAKLIKEEKWTRKHLSLYEDSHHEIWRSIESNVNRPWFERVWTIQEFVTASTVQFIYGD
jgi:hypothetical protein